MARLPGQGLKNDKGFTLIELMIVVTIIGILASVSIPRYISYVRTSQTAEVNQVAGQLVSAMQSYADSQSLTPAAAQALFNTYQLAPTGTSPSKDVTTILPQMSLPQNATFTYTIAAIVATAGTQTADVGYCITAVGNANAGVPSGQVLYSSSPALSSTGGWSGRLFNKNYTQGLTTLTGAAAGGYCTAAGAASATQS